MAKFMRKVLVIDPSTAGISGDMLLGAFVSLGLNPQKITEVAREVERTTSWVKQIYVDVREVKKCGFKAWRVHIDIVDDAKCRKGAEVLDVVDRVANALGLSGKAYSVARESVELLINTEAEVHGESIEEVHLCEIGSADLVIDVVGTALALQELDLLDAKVYGLPISVGGGAVSFSHGVISTPPPAVLEMAKRKGVVIKGGTVDEELATPTGVALYATLVHETVRFYPEIKVIVVGYGAGRKDFPQIPNILRLVVGEEPGEYAQDDVLLLETDIDDLSGEVLGYVGEKLISMGALDVGFIPKIGKKGRPSVILRVLAKHSDLERFIEFLMTETGTLGVRVSRILRYVVPLREWALVPIEVGGRSYSVRIKVSKTRDGKIVAVKPEYEDLKKISTETGVPLRVLMSEALKRFKQKEQGGQNVVSSSA